METLNGEGEYKTVLGRCGWRLAVFPKMWFFPANSFKFSQTEEVLLYEYFKQSGMEITVAPADREYGLRDFGVKDLDGNVINFGCDIS